MIDFELEPQVLSRLQMYHTVAENLMLGDWPVRRLVGNQLFLLAAVLSHNLGRELQMTAHPPERGTTPQRTTFWSFRELQTLRRTLLLRAGRLTRPDGELTLTLSANAQVRDELLHYLRALTPAA